MASSAIDTSIVFGEFPVSTAKLNLARKLNRGSGSVLLFLLIIVVLKNIFFAPPVIWNVYADPSFCPGSLKVEAKQEHSAILSCSISNLNSQTPAIIVNRISTLTNNGSYKVVAVLAEEVENDPLVIATLPRISDSELVRSFVSFAMNNVQVDIIRSAEHYWGIGESDKTDLALIDSLVDSGIFNPTSRIDDQIIKELAEDAISKMRLTKITDDLKVDTTPKDKVEKGSISIAKEASTACSKGQEVSCEFLNLHEDMLKMLEGPLGKITMLMAILMIVYSSVVAPNLILFASSMMMLLVLSNLPSIMATIL